MRARGRSGNNSKPLIYHCRRHRRNSELLWFSSYGEKARSSSVCIDCLDALRKKYQAATATGPRGLFDGLPARGALQG